MYEARKWYSEAGKAVIDTLNAIEARAIADTEAKVQGMTSGTPYVLGRNDAFLDLIASCGEIARLLHAQEKAAARIRERTGEYHQRGGWRDL